MKVTVWNAFEAFRCIAAKCEDSCCQAWEVDVDEDSAAYYLSLPGALGDRLRQVLKTVDGEASMTLDEGRCPMWRPDGLCRIQAELGHDALCHVCREFPRLRQDYGDFAEWGLELSCPEAARLIFSCPGVQTKELPGGTEPEYEAETMAILLKSREEALCCIGQADDLPEALAAVLLFAYQVQNALDGGEYAPLDVNACLADARRFAGKGNLSALGDLFAGLEILTKQWPKRLKNLTAAPWKPELKAFAVYLVRRYWLQAVWDLDLTCRVKFMLAACILVNALGGNAVETAQLFSKEIENDPDNLEALLDGAYREKALTDENLLGLLLDRKKYENPS